MKTLTVFHEMLALETDREGEYVESAEGRIRRVSVRRVRNTIERLDRSTFSTFSHRSAGGGRDRRRFS
jgi:hypothetical protein